MLVTDKVVFVTGGANGIGAECVKALLQEGAKVIIADVNEIKGQAFADQLEKEYGKDKVVFVRCDVSDSVSFTDAFKMGVETFSQIDIMFNNAGIAGEDRWESILAVNLKGVIVGTDLAIAHMRKDKGGQGGVIINTASDVGYTPRIYAPVYVASKYGVIGFTRSLASDKELNKKGVRFACICPDATNTPLVDDILSRCREGTKGSVSNLQQLERMSTKRIAEGLLSLIADDVSNDAVLEISLKHGMVRKKFTVENV